MNLSREGSFISFSNFDNCSKLLALQMLPKEKIAYLAISNSLFKEYLWSNLQTISLSLLFKIEIIL